MSEVPPLAATFRAHSTSLQGTGAEERDRVMGATQGSEAPEDRVIADTEATRFLAALGNVERAARELDALFEMDGGDYTLAGEPIETAAGAALLSLHDYLNDVENAREALA